MLRSPKRPRLTLEPDFQAQNEIQDQAVAGVLKAEEEEEETSSSCSFNFSYPSTSSSLSSSPVMPVSKEEKEVEEEEPEKEPATTLSPPHNPQSPCFFSVSRSTSEGGSNSQKEEDTCFPQTSTDIESLPTDPLDEKVADLVNFMILKYRLQEPVTQAEMLMVIMKRYRKHFPVIFKKASKFMEVIFGIDMWEVDISVPSYIFVNSLDLTSVEVSSDTHGMPKNGLLIIILGVIFIEGNCIPEEDLWDFLNIMGVYPGREHFIYGEPGKLITTDWVYENYLEYRWVPDSNPPRYEFLWGPRAHAEITKVKVLEFLVKIKGIDPLSFSFWYEEALKYEKERARARIGSGESTAAMFIAQH
ncbi:melanoma-associated antigen 10-like [Prionailurus viverrinus]|uniref:melanoma-associated antigen 10-like n=1 Tax=Prionailurus viverrinus TaxID=61388 RepID=UPI001FF58388|nr:melanoma-associated antigen 10-like [Prionailurus viverrinus]XP_047700030.1 melanoma-associated antigen 10-like [Prionailurus viverrinus]XP_047700031.1 melanoma-associated antigen 10-like [Prionailurus viverrinus]XP_047700032.1 melanoma-associated antigen 10-like [Prionailurus viverrinus]XP_047700033.1 melanoma-associated antigen 10-like [Prionailurus viverrinus]XP_047700035.1 melanoma-associated antigen 10-like [Prionailurus viverrinus]XP_047700036.1 melanoma-associated antigen 10-like [P